MIIPIYLCSLFIFFFPQKKKRVNLLCLEKTRKEKQKAKNKKTTTTKLLDSPGMKPAGTASKTRVFPHRQDGGKIPGGFLRGWGGLCGKEEGKKRERI